jgi:hypothetical protein
MLGGISGAYVGLMEFDNLATYEKLQTRVSKDEGYVRLQEFTPLPDLVPLSGPV